MGTETGLSRAGSDSRMFGFCFDESGFFLLGKIGTNGA